MTGCPCKTSPELGHGGLCCETSGSETLQRYKTFYVLSFIVKFRSNLPYNRTNIIKILLFRKWTVNVITDKQKYISDPEWNAVCVCVCLVCPCRWQAELVERCIDWSCPLAVRAVNPCFKQHMHVSGKSIRVTKARSGVSVGHLTIWWRRRAPSDS